MGSLLLGKVGWVQVLSAHSFPVLSFYPSSGVFYGLWHFQGWSRRVSCCEEAGKLFHAWMILCFLNLAAFNNVLFLMNVCMGSLGIPLATRDAPPVFLLKRMMNWLPTGCFPIMHSLEIHCYLQLLSAEVCPPSQLAQLDRPQEDIRLVDFSQQPTSGPWKSLKSFCFHKLWQGRPPPVQPPLLQFIHQ